MKVCQKLIKDNVGDRFSSTDALFIYQVSDYEQWPDYYKQSAPCFQRYKMLRYCNTCGISVPAVQLISSVQETNFCLIHTRTQCAVQA